MGQTTHIIIAPLDL